MSSDRATVQRVQHLEPVDGGARRCRAQSLSPGRYGEEDHQQKVPLQCHQHPQAQLLLDGDTEGDDRPQVEVGALRKQVHRHQRDHAEANHEQQPRLDR